MLGRALVGRGRLDARRQLQRVARRRLLDINLPDATGTQTLDELRVLRPDVPIIIVTANADEGLARETLTRGAFDYVFKPFDMDRIGQVLEAALNSQPR